MDVGSSAARAGVVSADGHLLGRAAHPFAVHRPLTDHAEHSSDEIWAAVGEAVRGAIATAGIDPARVAGLAFDATCSLALFDREGCPVTVSRTREDRWNVIMWADHRAIDEAQEMTATRHRVLDHVGGTMSVEMQLPKLLWLKRNLQEAWARYGLALDLADFLLWRATGRVAVSACTVTCKWTYLNHEQPGWQADFFESMGLADLAQRVQLPERAIPIGTPVAPLSARVAAELGLTTDCIVGVGLIDAHAGGIGVLGGFSPEQLEHRLALIAGTSTCHMGVSAERRPIPGVWGPYFGAMLPGMWLNEGGQSATGALLEHTLDWHAEGRTLTGNRHERVAARIAELLAAEGPEMLGDLHVLADFHGNRSPLADPLAKGAIHGLTLDSSFDSLARLYYAVAIGIALGNRHIIDTMNHSGFAIDHLYLTGGHAANTLISQLYADAANCTLVLPQESDGVLLGTGVVAAVAAGLYASIEAAGRAMVRPGTVIRPDPARRNFLDRRYRTYLALQAQAAALRANP